MKFSNNSLKKLIKGACYFEINNGYLDAYKYSKAQLDLIKEQICDKCWWDRATFTPGIRIEIETNSDFISFDYKIPYGNQLSARSNSLDVWVDGVLYSIFRTEALKGNFKIDLPKGNKMVVIYLPNDCRFSIKNFTIDGNYKSVKTKGQRVLVIGDSITQGYGPLFSSGSYFNALQRKCGYDMLDQGIGGYRCEARDLIYIDGFNPDKVMVFLGTNYYDAPDLYDYEKGTVDFYKRLNELYPDKEILAISPLWRNDEPDRERLSWCIDIIRRECAKYENITLIDGFTLVPNVDDCFCDRLHPNKYGCEILANNIYNTMKKIKF